MAAPRLQAAGLIAAMAVGSLVMWIGIPLGLVFLASKTVDTTQPTFGPYLIVLIGVPIGLFLAGRLLAGLDRRYAQVTRTETGRRQPVWLRSARGEREDVGRWQVLDVVMVWSVGLALVLFGAWFLLFAGSSIA